MSRQKSLAIRIMAMDDFTNKLDFHLDTSVFVSSLDPVLVRKSLDLISRTKIRRSILIISGPVDNDSK